MSAKVFLDTNVLVYAVDEAAPHKSQVAQATLSQVRQQQYGVISTQVLQEFYAAATRKLGIDAASARAMVRRYAHFEVVTITVPLIDAAMRLSTDRQLSFWDALIISAALEADCELLMTEDMNAGQRFDRLTPVDPFAQASY